MLTEEQIKKLKPGDPIVINASFSRVDIDGDIRFNSPSNNSSSFEHFISPDCVSLPSEYTRIYFPEVMFSRFTPDEKANLTSFLADYVVDVRQKNELRNSLKKAGLDLGDIHPKYDPTRLFKKGDKVRVVEWNGRHFHDRDYGVDIKTGCVAKIDESEKNEPKKCAVKVAYRQYLFTVPTCFLELVTPVEELEPYEVTERSDYYGVDKDDLEVEAAIFWKKAHPNAKAAAEAECARLNAEWRKEQNND